MLHTVPQKVVVGIGYMLYGRVWKQDVRKAMQQATQDTEQEAYPYAMIGMILKPLEGGQ